MRKRHQFMTRFLLFPCLVTIASAQVDKTINVSKAAPTVTAYTSSDRVRFTAPSSIVQIRLEVYNSAGKKVFDNEVRGGNVLDWHLQDGQAARLANETYLCVVTVKSLSGKLTERIGSVTVEGASASVQPIDASRITPQQSHAIGPVDENASLIVLNGEEPQTTTVIAHDGENGQITRGKGALSFRIGDFFRGKETEQMRLTPEGNLGIGVTNPQSRLDVAGAIRASQGIVFPDGSVQFSAARKTIGRPSLRASQSQELAQEDEPRPAISGSGTTGRLTKWLDGPSGVLGDSVMTELNGSIGINGPPNPIFKLDVTGHNRFRGSNVSFYLTGVKPGGNEWLFQTVDADGRLRIFDSTSGAERLSMTQSGNVGIGTASPLSKLEVRTAPDNYGFIHSDTNSSNSIRLGSYVGTSTSGATGGWLGTLSNHKLLFFTNAGQASMTIDTGGNVGIGVTPANGRLHVFTPDSQTAVFGGTVDGRGVQGSSTNSQGVFGLSLNGNGVSGISTTGKGVYGESGAASTLTTPGVHGRSIGSSGIGVIGEANVGNAWGVYGTTTSAIPSSTGVYGKATSGYAMFAEGNAGQSRDKSGFVKAMVVVDGAGNIIRCFNGIANSSTGNCGFASTRNGEGQYTIDFGYDIADRFYAAVSNSAGTTAAVMVWASSTTSLAVKSVAINSHLVSDLPFTIVVY